VTHAPQALERGIEDRPRRTAADVGDEADATGVAFVERAVQLTPLSGNGRDREIPPTAIDLAGGGGERNAG
jgi:hypothetical protein